MHLCVCCEFSLVGCDGLMPTSHPSWAVHITCSGWHPDQQFIFNQIHVSICNSDVPYQLGDSNYRAHLVCTWKYCRPKYSPLLASTQYLATTIFSGSCQELWQGAACQWASWVIRVLVLWSAVSDWHLSWLCQSAEVGTFALVIILWYCVLVFFSMLMWVVFYLLVCNLCPVTCARFGSVSCWTIPFCSYLLLTAWSHPTSSIVAVLKDFSVSLCLLPPPCFLSAAGGIWPPLSSTSSLFPRCEWVWVECKFGERFCWACL